MFTVQVWAVGTFAFLFEAKKLFLTLDVEKERVLSVDEFIDLVDERYNGQLKPELFLEDGRRNDWVRVMVNGRDIRFLPEDKLWVRDGDVIMISSVLAGG